MRVTLLFGFDDNTVNLMLQNYCCINRCTATLPADMLTAYNYKFNSVL